jgi:NADPH-dependent 2,4-dienoyl-CoA reductase/sulfur reductase-like enzyme
MTELKEDLRRIVVVGASLAGLRAAEALRDEGFDGELTIVGEEPSGPYDRPPLSKELLTGAMEPAALGLPGAAELQATWVLGERATAVDTDRAVVRTASGDEIGYDGLVLATGSRARMLPVLDVTTPSVHVLRTQADALALRAALRPGVRLLVIGCGFIGIEVASSARSLGADVTVVGLDAPVAPAGPLASAVATAMLERSGVDLHVGRGVVAARVHDGLHLVELSDGTVVESDHVLVAVGSAPNIDWLADSGVTLGDGVFCDQSLRVLGVRGVVAAGDIVRWPNPLFGGLSMRIEHWSNAVEQGVAAARSLLHPNRDLPFAGVPSFWSDHFGVRLQSVGLPRLADRFEVVDGDPTHGIFAASAWSGAVLVGAVSYGMPRPLAKVRLTLARSGVALPSADVAAS